LDRATGSTFSNNLAASSYTALRLGGHDGKRSSSKALDDSRRWKVSVKATQSPFIHLPYNTVYFMRNRRCEKILHAA
jgi:hypothetical protein